MTSPSPEVRRSPGAVSIDALARQWARQEAAPAGAAYVVDREISARRRGGVLWQREDSTAVAVVARPAQIAIDSTDLLWLAAGLGAADALGSLTGRPRDCHWPDGVELDEGVALDVAVTALTELGPGRIDYAILILRIAPTLHVGGRSDVSDALIESLRASVKSLEDPDGLLEIYRTRCATLGEHVYASLLPNGTTRGVADEVDDHGALVVRSPTGLTDSIAIAMLDELHIVSPAD
jgi:biotin-(acetyl-CoA carboxylase) ligase